MINKQTMPKFYATFCTLLIILMVIANHRGFTFTQLFAGNGKADKSANLYHK